MADNTAAPTSTTTEASDTGNGEADVDAQLSTFMVDSDGDEVSDGLTEEELAIAEGAPKEGEEEEVEAKEDEVEGEEKEEKEEEKPAEEQVWTVKVNGQEYDVDEKELIRGYQLGISANEKFQQAAATRKQAEQLVEMLQKDPLRILTNPALGINFRELAEKYLIEQLKEEQADPATRAQLMAERKLKELQAKEDQLNKAAEEREVQAQAEVFRQQIDKEFTAALARGKVPKTAPIVKRMAELASELLENEYDATADELVDMVRKEILQSTRSLTEGMNPDELGKTIGEDKLKAARQAALAKGKTKPSIKQFKAQPQGPAKKYISERELKAELDKALGRNR